MNDKRLSRTAIKLEKKYSADRTISEKRLSKQNKGFVSIFVTTILVVLIGFSLIICLSTFVNKLNRTPPSFFGYTFMQIATGSMASESIEIDGNVYSSGHKPKDIIVVHSVDTDTLNVGDKIAFYVSSSAFDGNQITNSTEITGERETKLTVSFLQFFGFPPKNLSEASKVSTSLVFHHIAKIYEDENGVRWFKTVGSTTGIVDNWVIEESHVIGLYNNSTTGKIMARVLHFLTTPIGLVATILVPLLLVGLLILLDVIRNAYLAKLELDVVEEKRKITDEACVKHNVGYRMSNKTKYKVLAQAEDDEKLLYLSLLWKDGTAPNALKKYCLQKQIYLHPVKQLLLLNRECEQMYKNGVDMEEIASHYSINKAKIEEKEKATNKRIRLMRKHYRQIVKKSKI